MKMPIRLAHKSLVTPFRFQDVGHSHYHVSPFLFLPS